MDMPTTEYEWSLVIAGIIIGWLLFGDKDKD